MFTSYLCTGILVLGLLSSQTAVCLRQSQSEASHIERSTALDDDRYPCPCEEKELCKPITHQREREVFGFVTNKRNLPHYGLSQLSTAAWNDDPEAMCVAHSHGVRVIADGRLGVSEALQNADTRYQWVVDAVRSAKAAHLDGINFDMEDSMKPGSDVAKGYTSLVSQTSEAFHRHIQGSQVSVDVPWSPYDVDGRNYDWVGLARAADILFIMSYDMQSQIYGQCVAAANSPAALVERGLRQWIDLGVPASKLVLGLPWYGYDYPCLPNSAGRPMGPRDTICHLAEIPFRGAPCSDAAGSQRDYRDIMQILDSGQNTTEVMWDPIGQSPYFNYQAADGIIHQVRYDDPASLSVKYKMASEHGLRGVGVWHLDTLDYASQDPRVRSQTEAMWDAISVFTEAKKGSAPALIG